MKTYPFQVAALAAAASMFVIAGCSSAVPRDLMAEEARSESSDRPVAMKGEANFGSGQLHVVATVARGFQRGPGAGGPGGKGGRRGGGGRAMKSADAFSENYSFDYGESEEAQKEAVQEYVRQAMARRAAGSPMPPVTLRIEFENKGTEPIEIVPTEVNSDLGNFAPRPQKVTVAPGERGVLEPMVSQLGVTNDEIPVTVSLKIGGGRTETQVIAVRNILAPSLRK